MRRLLALPLLVTAFAWAEDAPKAKPAPKAAPAKAAAPAAADPGGRAEKAEAIVNLLQSRRLTVKFEKATLDEFVGHLRAATGINIFVHKTRMAKDGVDPEGIRIDLEVKNVSAGDLLKLAFAGMDVGFRIEGNILFVTSKKDARGKPVLRIYSVAHLLVPIRDFPGRDMNVYPSNYEPPEPPEPEVVQTYESSEQLAELVREFTGQGTWEDEGVRITVFRNHLFIRTYPAVHVQIQRFLDELPQ
ncbi:MAG TPA: hypothetical protein VFY93_18565 [Planctomycetota bacterium]|nr:hypothetical protein [Planctomycetota bacterium]